MLCIPYHARPKSPKNASFPYMTISSQFIPIHIYLASTMHTKHSNQPKSSSRPRPYLCQNHAFHAYSHSPNLIPKPRILHHPATIMHPNLHHCDQHDLFYQIHFKHSQSDHSKTGSKFHPFTPSPYARTETSKIGSKIKSRILPDPTIIMTSRLHQCDQHN